MTQDSKEIIKKNDEEAIQNGAKELNTIFENVLPWTLETESSEKLLKAHTLKNSKEIDAFLNSFYLYKVTEISISESIDDISELIYKRQQALITASYQSQLSVITLLVGKGGGSIDIYFGTSAKTTEDSFRTNDKHSLNHKELFRNLANGIFPGKGIGFIEDTDSLSKIIQTTIGSQQGNGYGGIITGVPSLKIEDEKQTFDLISVIRSMNGKRFVLAIASRPVPKVIAAQQIHELMKFKDQCHSLAMRTVGNESGTGTNYSNSHMEGTGITETKGENWGKTTPLGDNKTKGNLLGILSIIPFLSGIGSIKQVMAPMATLGFNTSNSFSLNKSDTETNGWSLSTAESLSFEQQNSLAMELELVADKLIKRLRAGLNTGVWENFISYVTTDRTASQVLSGTLAGELIKADPDALPMRTHSCLLPNEIPVFIPTPMKTDTETILTGNKLVSFMCSDEAARLMAPPPISVPGFDIRIKPTLSLTDMLGSSSEGVIGAISEHGRKVEGSTFSISKADIRKHIFVTGITGCGKTTTVKEILHSAQDVPFLVLESAKREYRRLIHTIEDVDIFTVGNATVAPIRHNPFMILPGVSLNVHVDNLKSIFNASFSLYGPMPHILEKCLFNIYKMKGWNCTTGKHHHINLDDFESCQKHKTLVFPTILHLIEEVTRYVEASGYEGELKANIKSAIITRLESLSVGSKGFLFNTNDYIDIKDLLKRKVVFELESLADDDDKAFFVGLILSLISEYRQSFTQESVTNTDVNVDTLNHILVVEEAHRLLKNVSTERTSEMMGNPKGKAVESFCNIIAEMRALGQGVIVAEQIPTKIAPDVIKNTNTKIAHRLVSFDDQVSIGAGIGLTDEESRYLNQLSTGFALVHKEGMSKPVEVQINDKHHNSHIGDLKIEKRFASKNHKVLSDELALHESGLLWSSHLKATTISLLHSLFLSDKELHELIPIAIRKIRESNTLQFITDKIIIMAIEQCFVTILFSPLYNIVNGKDASAHMHSLPKDLFRGEWDRIEFIKQLDKLSGIDIKKRIRELSVEILISQRSENGKHLIRNIKEMFLIEDARMQQVLLEDIKCKVVSIC